MTTQKLTFAVTTMSGTPDSRSSATRTYTHAVLVTRTHGIESALSWHTSEALAHKAASSYKASFDRWDSSKITNVRVAPVDSYPYNSTVAKDVRAATKSLLADLDAAQRRENGRDA